MTTRPLEFRVYEPDALDSVGYVALVDPITGDVINISGNPQDVRAVLVATAEKL